MRKEKQQKETGFTPLKKYFNFNWWPLLFKTDSKAKLSLMQFVRIKNSLTGFALLEVLIVVAIISITTVISFSSWQSFSDTTNLGNTAKMIETKIKLAKNYSLSAVNDTNYGVHFEAASVTIFPGNVYTAGDPVNQVFALTDGVEIYSGVGNNIVFSRLTGITANSGTIGIRIISRPSKTKTIVINSQGQTGTDAFGASTGSPIANARHVHYALNWNIQNSTFLHLKWVDRVTSLPIVTNDINTASYFNVSKTVFDWSGTTLVNGVLQTIRIHSWLDGLGNTVLCVMRDQTENEKLNIYFTDGINKDIVTYTKNDVTGAIDVTLGAYGGARSVQ